MDAERLKRALIAADAAGDTAAATKLAKALRAATGAAAGSATDAARAAIEQHRKAREAGQMDYNPTDDMGALERGAAGAGKFVVDMGRAAAQLTGQMSRAEMDEVKRRDAALMDTTAGKVGNFAGGVAVGALTAPIPGVNTYTGAMLTGGALGALQPVGTDESRLLRTGLGVAGGAAGKYAGDKIAKWATRKPVDFVQEATTSGTVQATAKGGGSGFGSVGDDVSAGITRSQSKAMEEGKKLGMRMTPGQASGSKALQQFEAKLESQPMTSGPFNAIKANNQTVLNKAAAGAIGEADDVVDSTVLARATERISKVYESVADDVPRAVNPDDFLQRVSAIEAEAEGMLPMVNGHHGPRPMALQDHPLIAKLWRFAESGHITGRQAQDLASKLGKAATNQMTTPGGDRQLGMALFQAKEIADDFLQQGLDPARAAAFDAARQQYRNLALLTSRTNVVNPSSGNVSGRALASTLQQKDKAGFLRGGNQSPMYTAARFSQAFQPIVGDSGTATRSMVTNPLELALSAPFNLAARIYTSRPGVAAIAPLARGGGALEDMAAALMRRGAPYAPRWLPGAGAALTTYPAR